MSDKDTTIRAAFTNLVSEIAHNINCTNDASYRAESEAQAAANELRITLEWVKRNYPLLGEAVAYVAMFIKPKIERISEVVLGFDDKLTLTINTGYMKDRCQMIDVVSTGECYCFVNDWMAARCGSSNLIECKDVDKTTASTFLTRAFALKLAPVPKTKWDSTQRPVLVDKLEG